MPDQSLTPLAAEQSSRVVDDQQGGRRPWLTAIHDDFSRAVAGYAVNLGAPSALQTALAFATGMWREADPAWTVCSC